ncbi:hypothetical protein F2Q69_00032121 [Brassica cretica]|uniref:Uncharacterized protein n=1 Tax=Brassica cretica TaxID=69181 RepID=A0A8S9S5N0_BRACR|nr:hypothetical protein F2Q69_00032121 [Brassica cretica]
MFLIKQPLGFELRHLKRLRRDERECWTESKAVRKRRPAPMCLDVGQSQESTFGPKI